MTKQNLTTWIILMLLTVAAGLISSSTLTFVVPAIIILASLKFIGVAFAFMEMKKSHPFWKVSILSYLIIFCSLILIFIMDA